MYNRASEYIGSKNWQNKEEIAKSMFIAGNHNTYLSLVHRTSKDKISKEKRL